MPGPRLLNCFSLQTAVDMRYDGLRKTDEDFQED